MKSLHVLQRPRLVAQPLSFSCGNARPFSASIAHRRAHTSATKPTPRKPHEIDPRWLSTTKQRIGRCMMFGLKPPQVHEAGTILQQLARNWRELIAECGVGRDGFVAWVIGLNGHVNNVTYARYAETARVYFMRNYATHVDPAHKQEWMNLVSNKGVGVIIRSLKLDYKFPMTYPDKVTVYHKLAQSPSGPHASQYSLYLQAMVISEAHQRPAARIHEDLVTYDYRLGKKTALPPFLMAQCKATWELQEQAKKLWRERILEIEARVRTLEVESWDREDAVEDTGGR
ncbi:thioesterase/thiol ester dehydrase-isomerase [Aspergillus terreus]|uniref:Thioesterase/thiol ester dehydrase-isomerase n=1 Tax=Aspergillus terreus TaxID=33178 RepID=A0A5M3YWS9_ASPTE|nr:hypothetical protein ATETN484_0005038900 [Aspergillus terreus]GFF17054.1 thioesterase/thiol ester dehydrase-isomerase [Aspergillus terreus]